MIEPTDDDPERSASGDAAPDAVPDPGPDAVPETGPETGWSRRTSLRDGTPVLLRQVRPSDRQRLADGVQRLSPASRYLRFHTAIDRLSEEQLDYLTDVDHRDHEAIVALDLTRPDRPGVGVARFIREPYEPTVAEAAITVADEYHGQGAGTILLGALAARAGEEGIEVFRSYVLDGNQGMLEVFDHLGAQRERETSGLWRVDLQLPDDQDAVPRSGAGRAFAEIAREERTLASVLPPIWSRSRRRHDPPVPVDGTPSDDPMVEELEELRDELDGWLQERDER